MSSAYAGVLPVTQRLNIYLLPGIGLSVNYFDSLSFPDYCHVKAISLLQPEKNESLSRYAGRLMSEVDEFVPFVLIGMSFGGVLAQEMAMIRKPEAVILLSTIRHSDELPWYFRMGNNLKLNRIVPYYLVGRVIGLVRIGAGRKNRLLYDDRTASGPFLAWSLERMLNWRPANSRVACFQVHGDRDRLLPCRRKKDLYIISGASHLLLPGSYREVNRITSDILSALPLLQ